MNIEIWIFAQESGRSLSETSLEILSEARRLVNPYNGGVSAVLLGSRGHQKTMLDQLVQHGADRIFIAPSEQLDTYHPETYTAIIVGLLKIHMPQAMLFSKNDVTNDMAPRIAARIKVGLIPQANRLFLAEDGTLTATRLCFQRKVQVTVACTNGQCQLVTLEPGIMKIKKDTRPDKGSCETIEINSETYLPDAPSHIKVLCFIKANPKKIDISDADLIVCGGKGGGDKEQFEKIEKLAGLMGAALAGSRVAVDNDCIDRDRQIGQSGKRVSPALMISCGVSGANAHTVGMRETKMVIAINKDKNAPMIKMADLGVVGDLHEILPRLNKKLKSYLDHIPLEEK